MTPTDDTLITPTGHFQLRYALKALNKIPFSEYISNETGLTVCIVEVEGPVVYGCFCLGTEAFDDDGLPHTLEHLIFLGSEDYPFKGVLDLLANRCLASGTNAGTGIDFTLYTMETAGAEGFLSLMPIFLEHILYPTLNDEAFVTEVHHITGDGGDAGVVYCEMQGRENLAESRLHLATDRIIYPGRCGYSSEIGGLMKNLRESTNNAKVRAYHKEFYRPENLKVIIIGQINHEDVFRALEPLERKILSKGERDQYQRPWQSPVPPVETSKDLVIKYPSDDENNGIFALSWRGPSCATNLYAATACTILLKYLTENSASPMSKAFVEIEDPYASKVTYDVKNAVTCLSIVLQDVPVVKLNIIKQKLQEELKKLLDNEDIDMQKLPSIINRHKLQKITDVENSPLYPISFMIIGHMLYGNTKEELEQRLNPFEDLAKLLTEPKSFWLGILDKYFIGNKNVAVQCYPSKEEQQKMAKEEKERIEKQRKDLGEKGLKQKGLILQKANEYNDREPPIEMLTSVPIPSFKSIKFHTIVRYRSDLRGDGIIDLSNTSVFTYFDDVKTSFVYMYALLDTSKVPSDLRLYLPLLLQSLLELPIERDGKLIPYEEVIAQLNNETVSSSTSIGLGGSLFSCGDYSQTATVSLQAEATKYDICLNLLQEILYKTKFTAERIKVIAVTLNNSVAQAKRQGEPVADYALRNLWYSKDSNIGVNGMLVQNKFLADIIQKLSTENPQDIFDKLEKLRNIITNPSNLVLYVAGNLENISDPVKSLNTFLPADEKASSHPLSAIPDHTLLGNPKTAPIQGCVVGLGATETSFFYQAATCITSFEDTDLPALLLYVQYLTQKEGPMFRQIRGKGYSYSYGITVKVNEGLICLSFLKATNLIGAYQETKKIVDKQLSKKEWDNNLLESAKSSLIFKTVGEEKTIGSVVELSLKSYFQGVDYTYHRNKLELLNSVTEEDLNRVGDLYIAPLFDPKKAKAAVVTDPSKVDDIAKGFKTFGIELTVYPSLEESYLNAL